MEEPEFRKLSRTGRVSKPRHWVEAARTWMRKEAALVRSVDVERLHAEDSTSMVKRISPREIGKMVMFFYDPKHADKLPYYDTFPLVFPFALYGDRFVGLNMHYLPPVLRAKLMDRLYELATDRRYDEGTRLGMMYNYNTLKRAGRFRAYRPCVKEYLYSHVQSAFRVVHAQDWDSVLLLPTERFKKETRSGIWAASVASIR